MERVKRGLFVGRFQPIHCGHVEAIKNILEKIDEIIIIIGSSQKSHEKENPFTSGERMMMLRLALNEAGIHSSRYFIIPVPDLQEHSIWVAQVFSYSPSFTMVYSNEPLTCRLFKEAGIIVKNIHSGRISDFIIDLIKLSLFSTFPFSVEPTFS